MLVVLDTGPLFAAANADDPFHQAARDLLRRTDLEFAVPTLCIGEAAYLINRDLGPRAEAAFIAGCAALNVHHPTSQDFGAMARLMQDYLDFPLGVVDASVVVLAERLGAETIATLDHRHFRVIRPKHIEAFTLLP